MNKGTADQPYQASMKGIQTMKYHFLNESVYFFALFTLLVLCCILFGVTPVKGQNTDRFFRTIGPEQGLSHAKVNCIIQDRRGFLWFGTEDGLNRYDGRSFKIFRGQKDQAQGLSGNIITDLHEDNDGVIWIATADGGLTRYDHRSRTSRQFRQYRFDPKVAKSIPENRINKIADDGNGHLWLVTGSGCIVRLDKLHNTFDIAYDKSARPILNLHMDGNDTVWADIAGGGLIKINTRTLAVKDYPLHSGRHRAIPKKKTGPGFTGSETEAYTEDKTKHIWMARYNSGVTVIDPITGVKSEYRHNDRTGSIADDHVNVVYADIQGIVWIGTDNGISVYDPVFTPFKKVFLPSGGKDIFIYDFLLDEAGDLWIGTNNGIYIQRAGKNGFEHRVVRYGRQELAVTKLFSDIDGSFYLGTDYTLFRYNKRNNKITLLPNTPSAQLMKGPAGSRIVSVIRDTIEGHPFLLVSLYGHDMTYYDLYDQKWVSKSLNAKRSNTRDNRVKKLYKDKKGNIWLATDRLGLGALGRPGSPVRYYTNEVNDAGSISNNDVFDLNEDKKGNFWVSTFGGGLHYFKTGQGRFDHIEGSSNLTEGIQADRYGYLWMLSNGHFHGYDPLQKVYSCYDPPNLRSGSGLKGYIYKDVSGRLYAGATNYYIVFDPGDIKKISGQPEVFLTDLRIFDISYSHLLNDREIKLNHTQNYFSIEFSAPEYSSNHVKYQYILEGFDKSWINAGQNGIASYSNLPGGRYIFKVRAINWEGNHTSKFRSLVFRISPPVYHQWWFYTLILVIFGSLAYLGYRYRMREFFKRQSIRNTIAQDLHDQIGSTLSSISIYSKVARVYQEQKKPDKLKQVLDTIHETATDTITEMSDIVWAINPKNDHMSSLVQKIQSFARPLCAAKSIQFIFNCDERVLRTVLTMSARKNFYLILKESLNNAIKHSQCRTLKVDIVLNDGMMEVHITDDGTGFDPIQKNGSFYGSREGNGLKNIHARANELGAELQIRSDIGTGTKISLNFPLKHKAW